MKKIVLSTDAPKPIGPYSQAVEVDGWLFCSGQIPLNPRTGEVLKGSIAEQTKLVMSNIDAVLRAANSSFSEVVKTTIFLKSMNDFPNVNEVYSSYFESNPPARSTVEVSGLPKGVDIEIEVIARKKL